MSGTSAIDSKVQTPGNTGEKKDVHVKEVGTFHNIPGKSRNHIHSNWPLHAERDAVFVLISLLLQIKLYCIIKENTGKGFGVGRCLCHTWLFS